MYINSNVVLYTLSRYDVVRSHFMAVATRYTLAAADCWNCQVCCLEVFYSDCSYLDCAYFVLLLYCTFVCVCVYVFYVFYVCILSLPSGVINK